MFLPKKNRVSYWKNELIDQMAVLMGGRCAEELFVGDVSSGAQQDFQQATSLARSMVCDWGMSDKLGNVAYGERNDQNNMMGFSEKKYSEETAKIIDDEVRRLLDDAYATARTILEKMRKQVELMTQMLIEFETLDSEDVQKIMNDQWDTEEKRARVKTAEDLHKKSLPQPPQQTSQKSCDTQTPVTS